MTFNEHALILDEISDLKFENKHLMLNVQNYLADIWMNTKDGEYKISPEFEEENPKSAFQSYLKENKIEIKKIEYPTVANGLQRIAGTTILNVPVTIKWAQNGEEFTKNLNLDF